MHDFLKKLREEKGLTIQDLAIKTGISEVELRNLEKGRNKPSGRTIWKLSQALEYDYDTLFDLFKGK